MTRRPFLLHAGALILAGALLSAGCGSASPARKREAEARMRMGITYMGQNNLPMAMRELIRASELDPDNAEVEMMLGLAYRERGDLDKAEEHLRRAIDLRSDYADAHNNLGIVLADRKKWDEAIREFDAAAENVQYPTPEWAVYNAAEAYRSRGDAVKAEEAYRRAIRMNDRYAPAYTGLAAVLGNAGRWEESEGVLRQCVRLVPEYADGWMALGRVLARQRRTAEAAKAFRAAQAATDDPAIRRQAENYLRILQSEAR